MAHHYTPNLGYGPLRFGMTPADVEAILGAPKSFASPFDGIPIPDDLAQDYDGLRIMDFAATRESHAFPQVSFDHDKATAFTLFDVRVPFTVGGVDLFARDRKATLITIAAREDAYFDNGESFLFPAQGLNLPNARQARKLPYLSLVDTAYELKRLEMNGFEPSTALD